MARTRRPVRRRRSAKRRARARNDGIVVVFGLATAAVILLLLALGWLLHHLLLLLGLLGVAWTVALLVVRGRVAASRREHEGQVAQLRHVGAFLAMGPKEFEHALAVLCRRDGCTEVTVVGGAGDLAADVLATTPAGQRILIQAKRYGPKTLVGSQDVQKVNGTYRDVHRCDLALVVTTSTFTKAAAAFCAQVGIRAVDRRALALWAEGTGRPPWS
ncbi:restriction endonuclease [Kitasatospora sp. NPDC004615]|uniref:restriction endonuclease n=1 Tax=Kitasatospora sp. NPDC004615 TaxID=3364017 RepID=UPI0036ABA9C3